MSIPTQRGSSDHYEDQYSVWPVRSVPPRVTDSERSWGRFRRLLHRQLATVELVEIEARRGTPLVRHRLSDERWVVLDGNLVATVGACTWEACRGDVIDVPRGTPYRLSSPGSTVRLVHISTGLHDDADVELVDGTVYPG
jgi:mannose-6-phosphate isomerase-like protein (cupin superfamily)